MKNNIFKKFIIITITLMLIVNIPLYASALDNIFDSGKSFIEAGNSGGGQTITDTQIQPISKMVSNVLLTIAIGVTVISAAVMGINFVIQSVEDKAKIKESMVPWIIGIFVSFGAYGIWRIVMNIFYGINNSI